MGFQVVPALVVFQTPPEATATYQVARSFGWTASAAMRPDVTAGPMERNFRPLKVEDVIASCPPDWAGSGATWNSAKATSNVARRGDTEDLSFEEPAAGTPARRPIQPDWQILTRD